MYMSIRREYVSLGIFLTVIWNPKKQQASGAVTSVVKLLLRFSLRMPSEAAKNARTLKMKWHLVSQF